MFGPSSFAWLFAHEIRLLWRGSILVRTRRHIVVPIIGVGIVFQGIALAIAFAATRQSFSPAVLVMVGTLNTFFLFFLMLSRAMTSAIDVLYSRGDVDFLLASPIPPRRVLAVRMLGVAASTASPWLLLGGVLANAFAMFGHPGLLAAYPAILCIAILATATAFTAVVILVGWQGPRTARNLSHTMALLAGVVIFALGQAPHFIPAAALSRIWRRFLPNPNNAHALVWLPGRAMTGELAPLAAFLGFGLAILLLVLATLDRKFATGAISAAAYAPGHSGRAATGQFRASPFAAGMLKNLRLLLRFPGLATQTVYRSLTLVPVAMMLSGKITIGASPTVVVPLIVFLAGQLALFFCSVIIGSDQSPDLLRASPAPSALAQNTSAAAALYATTIIMALPLMGILLRNPHAFPLAAATTAGAALSNLALAQTFPIPLMRADFGKSQKGTILGLILGVSISTLWAAVAWLGV